MPSRAFPFPQSRRFLLQKLGLGLAVTLVFNTLYFSAQRVNWFEVTTLPVEPLLAKWIPLNFHSVWGYVSLYVMLVLTGLWLPDWASVRQFATGILVLGAVSFVFFVVTPTEVPRPSPEQARDAPWPYPAIIAMDLPRNGAPSLHASLAIFCAAILHGCASESRRPRLWKTLIWLWVAVIFWSTIALRQHGGFDLLTGSFLALLMLAAFRWWPRAETKNGHA